MKNTLETRLGIFFALALVVAVIILQMVGTRGFLQRGEIVRANFEDVQQLQRGAPVKIAGVEVGYVENIRLTDSHAEVEMRIRREHVDKIRTNTEAVIRATGLIGENYIALETPEMESPPHAGAPALAEPPLTGQTNAPARRPASPPAQMNALGADPFALAAHLAAVTLTGRPPAQAGVPRAEEDIVLKGRTQPDINALIKKLDEVAASVQEFSKSFSPESLSSLLGPLNDFVRQNQTNLNVILSNTAQVTEQIAQGEGTIGRLIYDEALYQSAMGAVTNLQFAGAEARQLIAQAQGLVGGASNVVAQINRGQGTLGLLATDETLYRETTQAVSTLGEILQKLNRGEGTFGKLITDESLYRNARLTLQKVERATEGLEDQGPLSVLGIAVNTLF